MNRGMDGRAWESPGSRCTIFNYAWKHCLAERRWNEIHGKLALQLERLQSGMPSLVGLG
jgi:hypothetical protein